jgi:hypothetical protein
VITLKDAAAQTGQNFFMTKGFVLGRGVKVYRVDRADVISREDFIRLFEDLKALRSLPMPAASAQTACTG